MTDKQLYKSLKNYLRTHEYICIKDSGNFDIFIKNINFNKNNLEIFAIDSFYFPFSWYELNNLTTIKRNLIEKLTLNENIWND
jgi:hypothetical protein